MPTPGSTPPPGWVDVDKWLVIAGCGTRVVRYEPRVAGLAAFLSPIIPYQTYVFPHRKVPAGTVHTGGSIQPESTQFAPEDSQIVKW